MRIITLNFVYHAGNVILLKIYIGIQHHDLNSIFLDGKKMKKQGPKHSTHYMTNHTLCQKPPDAEGMSYDSL